MSFPRHRKIYQSDEPEGGRTNGSTSLGDHRSDESSAGYSFVGCSPAEPASASPTATSLSQHPAAVNCSAAKRNLSPFFLSHLRGPLQFVPEKTHHGCPASPGRLLASHHHGQATRDEDSHCHDK
jgi:hypothetical protein